MIVLDYKDRRPLYEQVIEKIQELIFHGILEEDYKLPSVRSLAVELSINPNTIQRAYVELERLGFIYSIKGKGSFVAGTGTIIDLKQQEILKQLKETLEESRKSGVTYEAAESCMKSVYERK